jgi:hypothetical protein
MRTTRELREKLEKNAADSGRSLAQEVEHRLEQSFQTDDFLGGPQTGPVVRAIALVISAVQTQHKRSWRKDRDGYYGVFAGVVKVLRIFGPKNVVQPKLRFEFDEDTDADDRAVFDAIEIAINITSEQES